MITVIALIFRLQAAPEGRGDEKHSESGGNVRRWVVCHFAWYAAWWRWCTDGGGLRCGVGRVQRAAERAREAPRWSVVGGGHGAGRSTAPDTTVVGRRWNVRWNFPKQPPTTCVNVVGAISILIVCACLPRRAGDSARQLVFDPRSPHIAVWRFSETTNSSAHQLMPSLSRLTSASGRRLFSRGVIPRRNAWRRGAHLAEIPPGIIGNNHPEDPLPEEEITHAWCIYRRQDVNWHDLKVEGFDYRLDVERAEKFGSNAIHRAMVGAVQLMFQVPEAIECDRFACRSDLEAWYITLVDGWMTRGRRTDDDVPFAEFILSAAIEAGVWNYRDSNEPEPANVNPVRDMRAPDTGARFQHRFEWLCARRGRVITHTDLEIFSIVRRANQFQNRRRMQDVMFDGLRGGFDSFPSSGSEFGLVFPPEGMSAPPLFLFRYFAGVIDERRERARDGPPSTDPGTSAGRAHLFLDRAAFIFEHEMAVSLLHAVAMELYYNRRVPLLTDNHMRLLEHIVIDRWRDMPLRRALDQTLGSALHWAREALRAPESSRFKIHHFLADEPTVYVSRDTIAQLPRRGASATAPSSAPGAGASVAPTRAREEGEAERQAQATRATAAQVTSAMASASLSTASTAPTAGAASSSRTASASASVAATPAKQGVSLRSVPVPAASSAQATVGGDSARASVTVPAPATGAGEARASGDGATSKEGGTASAPDTAREVRTQVQDTPRSGGGTTVTRSANANASVTRGPSGSVGTASAAVTNSDGAAQGVARASAAPAEGAAATGTTRPPLGPNRNGRMSDTTTVSAPLQGGAVQSKGNASAAPGVGAAPQPTPPVVADPGSTGNATSGNDLRSWPSIPRRPTQEAAPSTGAAGIAVQTPSGTAAAVVARSSGAGSSGVQVVVDTRPASASRETHPERGAAPSSGAAAEGASQERASSHGNVRRLREVGRERVRVGDVADQFPFLQDTLRVHEEDNGEVVPLIGILERIAGLARRADPTAVQQSRGSRGGANGGSVARMAHRLRDSEQGAADLRRVVNNMGRALEDAQHALREEREESRRAKEEARRERQRANDAEWRERDALRKRRRDDEDHDDHGSYGRPWQRPRYDDGYGDGGGGGYAGAGYV